MTCKTQSKWYTQAKHYNNLLTSKNIFVKPTVVLTQFKSVSSELFHYWHSCERWGPDQLLTLVFITDFYWAKEMLSVTMFNTITIACSNMLYLIWNSKYCKCWQFLSSQMFSKTTRSKVLRLKCSVPLCSLLQVHIYKRVPGMIRWKLKLFVSICLFSICYLIWKLFWAFALFQSHLPRDSWPNS